MEKKIPVLKKRLTGLFRSNENLGVSGFPPDQTICFGFSFSPPWELGSRFRESFSPMMIRLEASEEKRERERSEFKFFPALSYFHFNFRQRMLRWSELFLSLTQQQHSSSQVLSSSPNSFIDWLNHWSLIGKKLSKGKYHFPQTFGSLLELRSSIVQLHLVLDHLNAFGKVCFKYNSCNLSLTRRLVPSFERILKYKVGNL